MTRKNITLPLSWSELTWQQLCKCWQVKMRYGGNPDVARVAALLELAGFDNGQCVDKCERFEDMTGERIYIIRGSEKQPTLYSVTARELSQMAKQCLPWLDYPYGDPGKEEVKDEKGTVIKERQPPVRGYVSSMQDALIMPIEEIRLGFRHFYMPQMACNNLTWQQYRAIQSIASDLFSEGLSEDVALDLQAGFLAHCLVPRSLALLDTVGGSIRVRLHHEYRYNAEQAEGLVKWFRKRLQKESFANHSALHPSHQVSVLFHICFQAYQTAVAYYAAAYPLLFGGDKKSETMRDALQDEVGTINTVMKYAGYSEQQQVYDSNLPFVLDILNTMAKEAKEIEKMNARIKKK